MLPKAYNWQIIPFTYSLGAPFMALPHRDMGGVENRQRQRFITVSGFVKGTALQLEPPILPEGHAFTRAATASLCFAALAAEVRFLPAIDFFRILLEPCRKSQQDNEASAPKA